MLLDVLDAVEEELDADVEEADDEPASEPLFAAEAVAGAAGFAGLLLDDEPRLSFR
ncbi:hypothetical protein GCM10009544_37150 [Streptomyces stramineus]|uniref:Uncharacterized protein n=1 Tax=Streptomyces stramineus TaxID=173861 RepID=A0ABP3K5D6_9ACTN